MKKKQLTIILILIVIGMVVLYTLQANNNDNSESTISPYAGQESRGIKSLSLEDIEGLQAGHGTPFGGMAKLAELNGYPGPRHVLDLADELELTEMQIEQIDEIYGKMNSEAIVLGEQIISIEQQIDDKFKDGSITEEYLASNVEESADIYGNLRNVHLQAHLEMMDILTPEQVNRYNELRGYTSDEDPCENIPEGHPEELWKMHHNCE